MRHLNHRLRDRSSCRMWSTLLAACSAFIACPPGEVHAQAADAAPTEQSEQWRTSPFHGVIDGDGKLIQCKCLFRGHEFRLGERVCMNTHLGTVMAMCDLQLNNTSWVPTREVCTTS